MKKTVLILGGTGLVGSHLLEQLCNESQYEKIYVLSRRNKEYSHPKIEHIVSDFKQMDFVSSLDKIDSIFSCLGTTRQLTPDKNEYLDIELGIPKRILTSLENSNNIPQKIHVVSAIGANAKASNFYMKMKGDLELLIQATPIAQKFIYQPAVILGERNRAARWWETIAEKASKGIDRILKGKSMKYHTIEAKQIAHSMVQEDLETSTEKVKFLLYEDMVK